MAQKAAANVQTSNFRDRPTERPTERAALSVSVTHLDGRGERGRKGVNNRSRYAKFCHGAERREPSVQICQKSRRIGCVIPCCNLQSGITQPIL